MRKHISKLARQHINLGKQIKVNTSKQYETEEVEYSQL